MDFTYVDNAGPRNVRDLKKKSEILVMQNHVFTSQTAYFRLSKRWKIFGLSSLLLNAIYLRLKSTVQSNRMLGVKFTGIQFPRWNTPIIQFPQLPRVFPIWFDRFNGTFPGNYSL